MGGACGTKARTTSDIGKGLKLWNGAASLDDLLVVCSADCKRIDVRGTRAFCTFSLVFSRLGVAGLGDELRSAVCVCGLSTCMTRCSCSSPRSHLPCVRVDYRYICVWPWIDHLTLSSCPQRPPRQPAVRGGESSQAGRNVPGSTTNCSRDPDASRSLKRLSLRIQAYQTGSEPPSRLSSLPSDSLVVDLLGPGVSREVKWSLFKQCTSQSRT